MAPRDLLFFHHEALHRLLDGGLSLHWVVRNATTEESTISRPASASTPSLCSSASLLAHGVMAQRKDCVVCRKSAPTKQIMRRQRKNKKATSKKRRVAGAAEKSLTPPPAPTVLEDSQAPPSPYKKSAERLPAAVQQCIERLSDDCLEYVAALGLHAVEDSYAMVGVLPQVGCSSVSDGAEESSTSIGAAKERRQTSLASSSPNSHADGGREDSWSSSTVLMDKSLSLPLVIAKRTAAYKANSSSTRPPVGPTRPPPPQPPRRLASLLSSPMVPLAFFRLPSWHSVAPLAPEHQEALLRMPRYPRAHPHSTDFPPDLSSDTLFFSFHPKQILDSSVVGDWSDTDKWSATCCCDILLALPRGLPGEPMSVWGIAEAPAHLHQTALPASPPTSTQAAELFCIATCLEGYLRLSAAFGHIYGWQLCYSSMGPPVTSTPWLRMINPSAFQAAKALHGPSSGEESS